MSEKGPDHDKCQQNITVNVDLLQNKWSNVTEFERDLTDILQIPVPTRAMVSLLGRQHNKCRPGRMHWRAKSEDCRARGAGTRTFALIKAYLLPWFPVASVRQRFSCWRGR
jgi:hypothetical protein